MKKLLIIFALLLGISGCIFVAPWWAKAYRPPSVFGFIQPAEPIIEDITPEGIFDRELSFNLLDVRTPEEFKSGYIFGADNIDFKSVTFEHEIANLDRERTYIVYCKSGGRSRKAVDIMATMGFTEVYNMLGGITAWIEEGYSIIEEVK